MQSPSQFNWLGLFALILSVVSIFFGFYFILLTKRIELRKLKFEKFCIDPLDEIFERLDTLFAESISLFVYRQEITDSFVDIQTLLLTLQKVYKNIPLQKIILLSEAFTDMVYKEESKNLKINDLKADYLNAKILIYNEFFEFGTKSIFSILNKSKSAS